MMQRNDGQLTLFDDLQDLRSAIAGVDLLKDIGQLRYITLGQLHSVVIDCSAEVHEGATNLFVGFGGMTSEETGLAYPRLCQQIRRYKKGEGPAPDWAPFFTALKRENLSQPVTNETSIYTLAELYWESHTRQD
jgi:hypothetical protein